MAQMIPKHFMISGEMATYTLDELIGHVNCLLDEKGSRCALDGLRRGDWEYFEEPIGVLRQNGDAVSLKEVSATQPPAFESFLWCSFPKASRCEIEEIPADRTGCSRLSELASRALGSPVEIVFVGDEPVEVEMGRKTFPFTLLYVIAVLGFAIGIMTLTPATVLLGGGAIMSIFTAGDIRRAWNRYADGQAALNGAFNALSNKHHEEDERTSFSQLLFSRPDSAELCAKSVRVHSDDLRLWAKIAIVLTLGAAVSAVLAVSGGGMGMGSVPVPSTSVF